MENLMIALFNKSFKNVKLLLVKMLLNKLGEMLILLFR